MRFVLLVGFVLQRKPPCTSDPVWASLQPCLKLTPVHHSHSESVPLVDVLFQQHSKDLWVRNSP